MAKYIYRLSFIFSDLLAVIFAWGFSFYIRFYSGLPIFKGVPDWTAYLKLVPFLAVIWFLCFLNQDLYKSSFIFSRSFEEHVKIIRTSFSCTFIFVVVSYFYNEYKYSRATLLFFLSVKPCFYYLLSLY